MYSGCPPCSGPKPVSYNLLFSLNGLEFSPNSHLLYTDSSGIKLLQYNLLAGSPAAIDASRLVVSPGSTTGPATVVRDPKLAPDGTIYSLNSSAMSSQIGSIRNPNALGSACQWQPAALGLQPRTIGTGTLPLTVNDLNLKVGTGAGLIYLAARSVCANQPMTLISWVNPLVTPTAYSWNFGDPASGAANTGSGELPTHLYRLGGQYTVTLTITTATGQQYSASQPVQVFDVPVVNLGEARTVCLDSPVLSAGPQPAGSTYRWHDGSTKLSWR